MFKSIAYKSYNPKIDRRLYELEDSEFGIVEHVVVDRVVGHEARELIIVREYSKRNLDVGKNLALYILWHEKKYRKDVKKLCEWQDEYLPEYMPNWKDYIPGRDEWLSKLLLLA